MNMKYSFKEYIGTFITMLNLRNILASIKMWHHYNIRVKGITEFHIENSKPYLDLPYKFCTSLTMGLEGDIVEGYAPKPYKAICQTHFKSGIVASISNGDVWSIIYPHGRPEQIVMGNLDPLCNKEDLACSSVTVYDIIRYPDYPVNGISPYTSYVMNNNTLVRPRFCLPVRYQYVSYLLAHLDKLNGCDKPPVVCLDKSIIQACALGLKDDVVDYLKFIGTNDYVCLTKDKRIHNEVIRLMDMLLCRLM